MANRRSGGPNARLSRGRSRAPSSSRDRSSAGVSSEVGWRENPANRHAMVLTSLTSRRSIIGSLVTIEAEPITISEVEADEIRELLPQLGSPRQAERHMARARLRRIRYPSTDAPTLADFERLVDDGAIVIDRSGRA